MKKTALFTSVLCLTQGSLLADVPLFINYQGKVYDSTGLPLGATGSASAPVAAPVNRKVLFRFYDAVTGGNRLWTEEQTVTIAVGEFSVLLGQGIAATGTAAGESRPAIDAVFTSGSASRYLEITVDNGDNAITAADVPITPRQQITTTAYSFRARTADSIAGSSDLAITPLTGTSTNYGIGWYGTGRLFNGVAVDGPVLYGNAGGALGSNTNGAYNTALRWNAAGQVGLGTATLAGAAASSKLVLQGDDASTPAQQLVIRGDSDASKRLLIGFDTTNNRSTLQSYTATSTTGPLLLNPGGGLIGIGTSAPSARLSVEGSVSATGAGGYIFGTGGDVDGGLFSPADGVVTLKTNGAERMRADASGNVGIGTTAPGFPLNFASSLGDKIALYGSSGAHFGIGVQNNAFQIHTDTNAADVVFGYGTSAAMTETMRIKGNGNVGIGTSVPTMKLAIADGAVAEAPRYGSLQITRELNGHTAAHMAFVRAGNHVVGMGYGQGNNTFGIGGGTTGAFQPNLLAFEADGTTRIGTSSVLAKLNVGSKTATWASFGRLTTNGASNDNTTYTNQALSIHASGSIFCYQVDITSDRRIKTAFHPSDPAQDLASLMKLKVTDYRFKDAATHGSGPQKKVIAQQVKEVFPQAVTSGTGVVPDIYQNAEAKDGWLMLATDLKVGERVRLVAEHATTVEEVAEVRGDAFRTVTPTADGRVFVYGREVPDLHGVDYDAIAMLNVSATQQIKREKDAEIRALREENSALRAKLAEQQESTVSLEARLIAIEHRLSGESPAPQTVSVRTANAAK